MMASHAIQDQQLETSIVTMCYQEPQLEIFVQLPTANSAVQEQEHGNISNMATCHQDPEPELDYRLELDVL